VRQVARSFPQPYAMFSSPKQCLRTVEAAARSGDWLEKTGIDAVDNRVLWTIDEDAVTLWFVERVPDGGDPQGELNG
jgi:hypothetical protein